jgi:hypothetical protein
MSEVKTFKKKFSSANILEVEVGTNTPHGGDAGHGGVTVFKLTDHAATAWEIKVVDKNGKTTKIEQPQQIELSFFGDTEADTFTDSLKYAIHILSVQTETQKKREMERT